MKRPAIPIDDGVGQLRYGEQGRTRVDAVFTIDVTRESVLRTSEVDDAMTAIFVGEGHLYGFEWPA